MTCMSYGVWRHFQQNTSYILEGSFIGGTNQGNQRNTVIQNKKRNKTKRMVCTQLDVNVFI